MPANYEATSAPRARASRDEGSPAGAEAPPERPAGPDAGGDEDRVDDLLGGLDVVTTADVEVPDRLVDQVIGQDEARDVVLRAAQQRRNVLMIGTPGTGKSMLSKAMSELLPAEALVDVILYPNVDDANEPRVRTVPAGKGEQIVGAHRQEARKAARTRALFSWLLIGAVLLFGLLIVGDVLLSLIAAAILWFILRPGRTPRSKTVPKLLVNNADRTTTPFVDATGAHAGALLGDVRHDPYQSGGMETPSHDRVEAGAIHKANGGVLYVDEVNTLGLRSQQHLLTAMQDREFAITGQSEQSSGALVHTDPVPTDFVLVAAGNLDAVENMHPALRSRIKGNGYEVYMDDTIEDGPEARADFVRFVAQEVRKDGRLPEFDRTAIAEVVLEARRRAGRKNRLTLEFRDLGGLVRVAGDIARDEGDEVVTRDHVLRAKRRARSIEQQIADEMIDRSREYDLAVESGSLVGRVNGLAVVGRDSGIVLPVVAEVTPAQGPGEVIATGRLQEVAEEAVQNVSAIVKRFSEEDLSTRDIHVQFVGSGNGVDGDSASITVATAVISALEDAPVDQSVAMTGSLSVRGDVLPVGGVTHKVEAAVKAGIETVIVPAANLDDVMLDEEYRDRVRVVPVEHIGEVLEVAIESGPTRASLVERIKRLTGHNVGPVSDRNGGSSGPSDPGPSPTAG